MCRQSWAHLPARIPMQFSRAPALFSAASLGGSRPKTVARSFDYCSLGDTANAGRGALLRHTGDPLHWRSCAGSLCRTVMSELGPLG